MRYALLECKWLSSHDDQKGVIEMYAEGVTQHILRTTPPGETFTTTDPHIINAPCIIHLQKSTRRTYISLILSNHIAAFPHDSGAIICTRQHRGNKTLWRVPPHPEETEIKIGEERFEQAVGHFPQNWELDRANCQLAGTIGHYACGWCYFHQQPVLMCGCRNRED